MFAVAGSGVGDLDVVVKSSRGAALAADHGEDAWPVVQPDRPFCPLEDDRSWLYFADPDVPFYRVTNFAKYAAANVPGGDTARYSSFLTETFSGSPSGRRALSMVKPCIR